MYQLIKTFITSAITEEPDVSKTHIDVTSVQDENYQNIPVNKISDDVSIEPPKLDDYNIEESSNNVLTAEDLSIEENKESSSAFSQTKSDFVQNDCEDNPCYSFVESAMYVDLFCLKISKNIQEIILQCETPIAIVGQEPLNVVETPQVFLWMIEEAVTNSFQVLNFHDDAKAWNSFVKGRLRTMRNTLHRFHRIVEKIDEIFTELESKIKKLRRKVNSILGGNRQAAAFINGKYALEKYKEDISVDEKKKSLSEERTTQENDICSLQFRLSFGYLSLKSKCYFDSWIKFKSISSLKHRRNVLELMILNFSTIASSATTILYQLMNSLQSDTTSSLGNYNSDLMHLSRKLDKITEVVHYNHAVKFSPKEQTIMLANWQKAEIGLDFLLSKIKKLFGISENLQLCTNRLLKINYLEFVADDGRSTVSLDKFSSVEIEIKTRDEVNIHSIFEKYFGVGRQINVPSKLKPLEKDKGDEILRKSVKSDQIEDRIIVSENECKNSESSTPRCAISEILTNEVCNLANEIENIPEEYKNAIEDELSNANNSEVRESHVNLCSDRIRTLHQQILFHQKTISRNKKIIFDQADEIFDVKEDSLNVDLRNCIAVTFQLIKTCEFRTGLPSRDKVAFQNHFEEVLRYFCEMKKLADKYKEAVETKMKQINIYVSDIAILEDFFKEQRTKYKVNTHQVLDCKKSEIVQKGLSEKYCGISESSDLNGKDNISNEEKKSQDTNSQIKDGDDILFYEIKMADVLSQVSIFANESKNPDPAVDSTNKKEESRTNSINYRNRSKKPFEIFSSESHTKILFFSLCHMKELCNSIASNLRTMISTIDLRLNLTTFLRTWLKVDENIRHYHKLEILVLCKSLFGLESMYCRHLESFGNFETLLGTLTGFVELLQNLIIYKGMIEHESKICFKNTISSQEKDILEEISRFGISEYDDLVFKIKKLYLKKVTKEIILKRETNNSANVECEEKTENDTEILPPRMISVIPDIFNRLTHAENKEFLHKPFGISANQFLCEKLKQSNSFILGGFIDIVYNLCCPKVSQEYEKSPVAYVNILAFLICNTSSKLQIPQTHQISNELLKEFRKEYLLVKSVIRAFERAGKKANALFDQKIKSFVAKKQFTKKCGTEEEMNLIIQELGSPSAARFFSNIWNSANEQFADSGSNQVLLSSFDEFDFTWNSTDENKLNCSSFKNENNEVEFSNMKLEIQIKLIVSLLRMIRDALRKSEMSFLQFNKNIGECRKELKMVWKRNITKDYYKSAGFALHTLLLKYVISEAGFCFQNIADIVKNVKYYILYGFTCFFGTSKEKTKLHSMRAFKPVQCGKFSLRVKCDPGTAGSTVSEAPPLSVEDSTSKYILEQHLNKVDYVPVDIEVLPDKYHGNGGIRPRKTLDSNSNAANSNIIISEGSSLNTSTGFPDKKFFEQDNDLSNESLEITSNRILLKAPAAANFDKIALALKRFEDLLNSGLKQSLEIIKYPNSAVKDIHFLELGNRVDNIKGIVTLIACASTDLNKFTETRAEIINPLEMEFMKAESYFRKNFLGKKSYATVTKLNINQIQRRMYDFVKETLRDSDKLMEEVLETFEIPNDNLNMEDQEGVDAKKSSQLFYDFDLANNLAKQISGSLWNVRWGMDNLGVLFTSKITQEKFLFKSLSLESQLNVLTLLVKFLVFILQTATCTMSAVKKNLDKSKRFYTTQFLKSLQNTFSSSSSYATPEEQKEFIFFVTKFNKILRSSNSTIDDINEIAETTYYTMLETRNYIKTRVTLETTRKEQSRKMIHHINSYRNTYNRRIIQFRSNLLHEHFCPIGIDAPLTLTLQKG